jgi:putative ABC transport system permease protein
MNPSPAASDESMEGLAPLPGQAAPSWATMLGQSFRAALRGISDHKLRSILTIIGILVSVCGVMLTDALGRATANSVSAASATAGANMIGIDSSPVNVNGQQIGASNTLTEQDVQSVAKLPHVTALTIVVKSQQGWTSQIVAGPNNDNTTVQAVYPQVTNLPGSSLAQGTWLTADDENTRAPRLVIGDKVSKQLFPNGSATGQQVRLNGTDFTVAGVLRPHSGGVLGNEPDDHVYVPFSTALQRLMGSADTFGGMYLKVDQNQNMPGVIDAATKAIEQNHHIAPGAPNDFRVSNFSQAAGSFVQGVARIKLFLTGIAALALIIGGFGIANVMLASVGRRTREIGVRMAVGAQRRDVLLQFLLEAATLSLLGGLVGAIVGAALILVLGSRFAAGGGTSAVGLQAAPIAIALALSVAVGVIFGYLPAQRAARLDPIRALRQA